MMLSHDTRAANGNIRQAKNVTLFLNATVIRMLIDATWYLFFINIIAVLLLPLIPLFTSLSWLTLVAYWALHCYSLLSVTFIVTVFSITKMLACAFTHCYFNSVLNTLANSSNEVVRHSI